MPLAAAEPPDAGDDDPDHIRLSLDPDLTLETGSRGISGLVAIAADAEAWLSRPIKSPLPSTGKATPR